MKRIVLAAILACGLASPAVADVTVKMSVGGKGMGISGNSKTTTYIKGNKMRSDMVAGDKVLSTIFDLDAQKMYSFEAKKKDVDVWDMATFASEMSKSVDTTAMKASIKPNGQTKAFGNLTATGYDMEISVPASMGGNKDMQMLITMTGPVWIVKNAPGSADYNRFYRAAVEKGWIFSNPSAAKAQPGQAKAMAEMFRQFAEIGGVAYEIDTQIKMSGSGPMAGLMSRLGNVSMLQTVESVSEGPVADDLFAPPPGSKLNQKK
jgi:hypothetical protein